MKISTTLASPPAFSGTGSSSDEIGKLLGRIKELTAELKSLTSSDMDPKAKQDRAKLIQAQIKMLYAQIAAIQRERQQAQQQASTTPKALVAPGAPDQKRTRAATLGPGALIDVQA